MNPIWIACVVEGHGEEEAVPCLIRRLAQEMTNPIFRKIVVKCVRVSRSKIVKEGELERAVKLAVRECSGNPSILILIDADDDCPATLGPKMLERVQNEFAHLDSRVVIAKREYEAWFVAAIESLIQVGNLKPDSAPPEDPDEVKNPKKWIEQRMITNDHGYSETIDQVRFTANMSFEEARKSDSFDKFYRDVTSLLRSQSTDDE